MAGFCSIASREKGNNESWKCKPLQQRKNKRWKMNSKSTTTYFSKSAVFSSKSSEGVCGGEGRESKSRLRAGGRPHCWVMDLVIWFKARRRAARLVKDALRQTCQHNSTTTQQKRKRSDFLDSRRACEQNDVTCARGTSGWQLTLWQPCVQKAVHLANVLGT